jgi:hypothetical protein
MSHHETKRDHETEEEIRINSGRAGRADRRESRDRVEMGERQASTGGRKLKGASGSSKTEEEINASTLNVSFGEWEKIPRL